MKAILKFQQMQEYGVQPNVVSIIGALLACINMASLQNGSLTWIFDTALRLLANSNHNLLVDMYAKYGNIDQAKRVFDMNPDKELPIYSTMQ
ncbi:hypothetical protein ACFX13_018005 [Malus domestica]